MFTEEATHVMRASEACVSRSGGYTVPLLSHARTHARALRDL